MAPIRECRKSQHKSRLTRPFGLKWANSPSFARSGDARAAGPLPQGLHPLPVHSKRLRDFIDSNHLLIRIDEQLDFAKIAASLEERNCPDFGRPAVHPEVMVRALLIRSLYNIASFRRLCSAISENICYPWFCFLTSDDPVFDHSTITHFINRIGREGFSEVFDDLNRELLRSSRHQLVKASGLRGWGCCAGDVRGFQHGQGQRQQLRPLPQRHDRGGVQGAGHRGERAVCPLRHKHWRRRCWPRGNRYFQDAKGRLPLSPVDTDARWRTTRPSKPSGLKYQENVITDRGGFVLARDVTHASIAEWKSVPQLLEQLPLQPVSLMGDTAYNAGELRQLPGLPQ